MAKKFFSKALSLGLSLALCAGMIIPAFAADAYFYVKVEEPPEITDQQKDEGKGINGNWAYMGKGEAPSIEEIKQQDTYEDGRVEFSDGQLPEGYELPTIKDGDGSIDGYQSVDGWLYVKPFHDIGDYQYDDETGSEVGRYTYTIEWDNAQVCDVPNNKGFNFDRSEALRDDHNGGLTETAIREGNVKQLEGVDTIHVNGTATLHDNAEIKVVVVGYENGGNTEGKAVETDAPKYVRDTDAKNLTDGASQAKVEAVAEGLAKELAAAAKEGLYALTSQYDETTNTVTATYTEQTYKVTYQITGANSGVDVSELNGEKGKASEEWKDEMVAAALRNREDSLGLGYYTFSGWSMVQDEDGNVTLTAVCTYRPYNFYTPTETVIDDTAIPLASGPITRAEFIDYLWRHEGEPASEGVCTFTDVTEEHEYFEALCWADENGVAEAYFEAAGHEDGTFEPDELVTVAAVREFLGNFETVFGAQAVAAAELASLTGADDEAVLNCDEVLAEFFGEEYAPAVDEDEIAA